MKYTLIAALVALQVADVLTTEHFLHMGTAQEGNPLVAALMAHLGSWWWAGKLAIVLPCVALLAGPRARLRYAVAAVAWYVVVVANNLVVAS